MIKVNKYKICSFQKRWSVLCLMVLALAVLVTQQAAAQVATVPLEFTGKHLFIKVKAGNNDTLRFVFDTGATGATIDSLTAERAGISKQNRQVVSVAGSGGAQSYNMAVGERLEIGKVALENVNLVLINFAPLSAVMGSRIDGIIGYEVLDKYTAKIDFDNKQLLLYNSIAEVDTAGYTGIPFEFNKGINIPRFSVSVSLASGDTFTGRVMFDTGNAGVLLVSTPFARFHDFSSKLGKTMTSKGRGLNAETRDELAVIEKMSFNGFDFGKMPISVTVNERAQAKDGYLGILGIQVIRRFHVIVDYAHQKIYLKPNKAFEDPFVFAPGTESLINR